MLPLISAVAGLKKTIPKRPLKKRYGILIPVLILLSMAIFLRIYRLEDFPIPVNLDELSNFYDGYSIVETGADRWGLKYPVILRGFGDGDYKPSLFTWLSAGTIKVLGYSIFAGRLPSVLLGMVSLLLVYLTAKKIGGRLFAYLSLLSAAFSPWHLSFSRLGLESAMLIAFFVALTLYLWIRIKEKQYPVPALILSGLVVGLSTSTAQAGKLIFFLLAFTILADIFIYSGRSYKKVFWFGGCCLIGAVPQLLAVLMMPERFVARANDTMLPFTFTFYYGSNVLRNIFSNISPAFLFFSFSDFNNETTGRLLPVEFPFFYLGLFHLGKAFKRPYLFPPLYFYLLLLIVIVPSALTVANPHALRASGLIVLLPMVSAAGIVYVLKQIRNLKWKKVFLLATVGLVVANALYFVGEYAGSAAMQHNRQQNYLALMSARLNQYKDNYSRIYIENMGNQPYIYVTHYCQITPRQFQRATKVIKNVGLDLFVQLDKYYFLSRTEIENEIKRTSGKRLLVLQERHPEYKLIDSIEAYNHKKIFFYEK